MARIGPHSRPGRLAIIDGRSAEAQAMKRIRDDLARHVGGNPSVTQKMLIERCAVLTLRIQLMDRQQLRDSVLTERNAREYLCWTNSLSRLLRQLGMKGAAPRQLSPIEVMRQHRGAAA
jgi:hypothetical protein